MSSPGSKPIESIGRLTAISLLSAGLGTFVLTLMMVLGGAELAVGAVVLQTGLLLLLQLLLAYSLGWCFHRRALEAASFTLPLALALEPTPGSWPWAALIAGGSALCLALLWGWLRRRTAGAPTCGALLGWGVAALVKLLLAARAPVTASLAVSLGRLMAVALVLVALGAICVVQRRWTLTRRLFSCERPLPALLGALLLTALALGINLATPKSVPHIALREQAVKDRPPIVLIVLDGLRADHLRLYGYPRDTMPRLEAFARQSTAVAERSISTAPSALPAHASLFTGLNPIRHGAHGPRLTDSSPAQRAYPLPTRFPTLAALLSKAGYWTVGIAANTAALSPASGLARGFDAYTSAPRLAARALSLHPLLSAPTLRRLLIDRAALWLPDTWLPRTDYRGADVITDQALSALELARDRSFFLFANYMDAHAPHGPPKEFLHRYPGFDPGQGISDHSETARLEVNGQQRRDLSSAERAHGIALYDGSLAYLDQELGRLLQRLRQHPRWKEMLIIITADHGMALGEHRELGESSSLYNQQLWVPLLIKAGAAGSAAPRPGTHLSQLVQPTDLFPSILHHAGVQIPDAIDGVAWGRGRSQAYSWSFVDAAMARRFPRFRRERSAIQTSSWKIVLNKPSGLTQVFDLRRDPGELKDVSRAAPPEALALKARLVQLEQLARRLPHAKTKGSGDTLRQLKSLGYIQ